MVGIDVVEKHSPAEKAGIAPGDILIGINGHEINDVLDYRFYLTDERLVLKLERDGKAFERTIEKDEYEDIGLDFKTYLMDKKHSCKNKCVFCFIDQLPKGLRETLYFKDDDDRLSFLMGNYVTLTNLRDEEVDRIIKMHLSPINVSVHTTNPELRCKMMKNPNAGRSLEYLKRFAENGITLNCQIVLCKGLNDGDELISTMHDLASLHPAVQSVSVVPVGLTDHREGLYPLEPFDKNDAFKIVKTVENFAALCKQYYKSSIFFCGDELYLKAGLPIPDADYYEDFSQIENGVGMLASLKSEFDRAIEDGYEVDTSRPRRVSLATGEAAYGLISSLLERLKERFPNLEYHLYEIKNDFFGHMINVSGLIVGRDLYAQLVGKELGDTLFLPRNMLESGGRVFLDDMSVAELSEKLNVEIKTVENDGYSFITQIMGIEGI